VVIIIWRLSLIPSNPINYFELMTVSIRPFKAFRPDKKWVEEVVLPTFDNLTEKQLDKILKKSKYNFLNVVSPEAFYPNISKKNSRRHASQHLKEMIDNEIIFQDSCNCFYVYCLHKYGKKQFGLVASVNVKNKNKNILKHEDIYASKANSILKTIENTKMQVGPVYLSYKEKTDLNKIYSKYRKKKPLYKFKTPGGTERSLWKVDNLKEIKFINNNLSRIKNFYIADGHHRFAAMESLRRKIYNKGLRKKNVPLLAAIFNDKSVNILSFHRLVKIKNFDKNLFLNSLKEIFPQIKSANFKRPSCNGELMIYVRNKWYYVELAKNKKIFNKFETDVEIVEKVIIKNILKKYSKFKLEKMINVPGKFDHKKLMRDVNSGLADVAFFICPMKMKKIMSLADRGKIVPKKSTYFDPKPADGLVNLLMNI